jgi:RNA polymerase sigma-70 factor (ECF subfamily)
MGDDERSLVAAARQGDVRAYSQLVAAHGQALRGFLRRFTGHWAGADDIAQEAFVVAWRRIQDFRGQTSFRAWVCGIGFRLARGARRAHARTLQRDTFLAQDIKGCARTPALDDRLAIEQAMKMLSEGERAAVSLCLGEGFTHQEAARVLKLPLGTVKSHVLRGKEKLLLALAKDDTE